MTESSGQERRPSSLKSLLERLDEAETDDRGAGQGAVRPPLRPHIRPVPSSGQSGHQSGLPVRQRAADFEPDLERELGRALERRAHVLDQTTQTYRLPLILGGAAVAGGLVALPVAYLLLSSGAGDGGERRTSAKPAVVRSVETTVVTAEQMGLRAGAGAPPVEPRLVQPPEQRRRATFDPPAPVSGGIDPKLATDSASQSPLTAAVQQQIIVPPQAPPSQLAAPRAIVDASTAVRSGQRAAFPLRIEPAAAAASVTRVVVRGLPATVTIPQAARGPAGSLIIPADQISAVQLEASGTEAAEAEIEIELQGAGNAVLDRTVALVRVLAPPVAPTVAREAPPATTPTRGDPRADQFFAKGKDLLLSGDVAGARLMLERAVDVGSPSAALLLGETYDPEGLQTRGVRGMTPDPKQARVWYERAKSLGVGAAEEKLRRLPNR